MPVEISHLGYFMVYRISRQYQECSPDFYVLANTEANNSLREMVLKQAIQCP